MSIDSPNEYEQAVEDRDRAHRTHRERDTMKDQEDDARVDGERRAAGPTGSTAASNGIIPT